MPTGTNYRRVQRLLREAALHTVCEGAHCPNVGDCWERRTATFMILGDVCTRNCRYCAVTHGRPAPVDAEEPLRVALAVEQLALRYAVVTSVTRDDLPDGGAAVFADTIRAIRQRNPECAVEVLVPDFGGDDAALQTVLDARPQVLNHNIEVARRLFPQVRPQGDYLRSLYLLRRAREMVPEVTTKSGLMVGLGETWEEVLDTMRDLRGVGCNILTIGQYLQPSRLHYPVARYYTPSEFVRLRQEGEAMGFAHVASGPLVRSSYHADEHRTGAIDDAPTRTV